MTVADVRILGTSGVVTYHRRMASGGVGQVRDRGALLRALVLVHRYSVEITRIAATTLGSGRTDNRDVQLLVLIHGEPGVTAGRLRTMTGMARTAVSRSLAHLDAEGLVVRSVHWRTTSRRELRWPRRRSQSCTSARLQVLSHRPPWPVSLP
jgi:hypothetical protein